MESLARGTGDGVQRTGCKGQGWLGQGCAPAVPPLQYHLLPWHYQFLLVTAFLVLSLAEGSRLYLGYVGNLQEKVSAVSLPWPPSPLCSVRDDPAGGAMATLDVPLLRT